LNNKAVVNAQKSIVIEVDLLFVMARTVTLNWEIPIGVPGLGIFWGYFDTMVMWQHFVWCLSKFKEMLKDTGLFKSTKSVPMAGLSGYLLEYPDWRTTAFITMRYRPLTDHQNELQGEEHSGQQLTTMM
jgi:hypothetical protein